MSPSEGEVRNEKRVLIHKGAGRLAEVKGQYSTYRPEYSGGGKYALADGETGSDSYCDGKWQGYQGQDVELTYRWAEATDINSVTVRFLQNFHDWILAPTDIEVYVHEGNGYTLAAKQHFGVEQISGNRVGYVTMNNLTICTNDLKVIIRNPGKLPKEHQAPDHDSYIFLDEVIIN
jgi:hexosaminidase